MMEVAMECTTITILRLMECTMMEVVMECTTMTMAHILRLITMMEVVMECRTIAHTHQLMELMIIPSAIALLNQV